MKQIVILLTAVAMTLAAPRLQGQCGTPGTIDTKVQGDTLLAYLTEMPTYDCGDTLLWGRIIWTVNCNPFDERGGWTADTLPVGDTLRLVLGGAQWRSVQGGWLHQHTLGGYTQTAIWPTNKVVYATGNAPQAALLVTPSPNDGHFEITCTGTAYKQRVMVLGPYGLVMTKWLYGDCTHPVSLLPMNPNGQYTVLVDWYFDDDCTPMVRTRKTVMVIR